ncbi:hypothetical protein QJS66_19595 [Kocuria rhizophila]|nr:hypothetical protein QJS66_19595 [Kocuria rhizophila]
MIHGRSCSGDYTSSTRGRPSSPPSPRPHWPRDAHARVLGPRFPGWMSLAEIYHDGTQHYDHHHSS